MAGDKCVETTRNTKSAPHIRSYFYLYCLCLRGAMVAQCCVGNRKANLGTPFAYICVTLSLTHLLMLRGIRSEAMMRFFQTLAALHIPFCE
jgi:hypothetical protein